MKSLIISALLLLSITGFSQDSTYNATVKFNLSDSVENGMRFQRKAFFEACIYNQRMQQLSLQFRIEFYNSDGTKKMNIVKSYTKEIVISNERYVITATGEFVGDLSEVLARYGILKPVSSTELSTFVLAQDAFKRTSDGRYELTTPCMGEYDYLLKGFDGSQKLHAVIKKIGQREAAAGRLE